MDGRFGIDDLRLLRPALAFGTGCLLMLLLVLCGGCETPAPSQTPTSPQTHASPAAPTATEKQPQPSVSQPSVTVPTGFGPVKVSILPLSEIAGFAGAGRSAKMSVYVALLDAFGCPVKAPCTLRFELYEYVRRSAQAKGQRIMIWPDIDLMHPAENHKYWRDFLRAYEFELDVQADRDTTYVLETTCLSPDGRRLSVDQAIRSTP